MSARLVEYPFTDDSLRTEALTHRSAKGRNYERLEFLGDSILSLVISTRLYELKPDADEGDLSRLRASLVNGVRLAEIGEKQGLGDHLIMGSGELKTGGHRRASILADVVEALLGAIYLDSDYAACEKVILELYAGYLEDLPDPETLKDPKTRLQEFLQSRKLPVPSYKILEETGKAHNRHYKVSCVVESYNVTTTGEGSSRRKAEQAAAEVAFRKVVG